MFTVGGVLRRGVGEAVNTLCSQAYGAKKYFLVSVWLQVRGTATHNHRSAGTHNTCAPGVVVQIGMLMLAAICVPIAVAFWFTGPILAAAGFTGMENHLAAQFARWSIIGIVPEQLSYILKQYLQARQDVMPALVTSVVCAALNVGANQLLIHGAGSWGGLGFKGSPLATACTNALMGASLGFYTVRPLRWQCVPLVV